MITVSTSPPKKTYHHGDLAEALVEAALAILTETGSPSALSLREAARRADVSPMAPYRHFADKDALLAAVGKVGFDRLAAALRKADRAKNPTDALVGQGVAYVAFADANPALFRLMFGAELVGRGGDFETAGDAAYQVMAERVAAMSSKAQSDDWAMRCWATAHGLASLAVDGQLARFGGKPAVLAERILRLSDGVPS